ncbi:MAG: hypothetical protein ABW223_08325, partial [Rariglobus sp.]
ERVNRGGRPRDGGADDLCRVGFGLHFSIDRFCRNRFRIKRKDAKAPRFGLPRAGAVRRRTTKHRTFAACVNAFNY